MEDEEEEERFRPGVVGRRLPPCHRREGRGTQKRANPEQKSVNNGYAQSTQMGRPNEVDSADLLLISASFEPFRA